MALVFTLSLALSGVLLRGSVSAAQVTSRSIKMSSSAVSASSQTYSVSFTVATTGTIQGIVVDFCSNSPIVGDSCTATVGTNVPNLTASPAVTVNSGLSGTWTAAQRNSNRTLTLTNASGGSVSSGTAVNFDITTVTNPSATGAFYGRILTYTTTAGATTTYAPGSEGSFVDYGGIALSTAAQLTITAKVMETLTFCVYTSGSNCAGGTGSSLSLGDSNGVLISNTTVYTGTANFGVASNAQSGVKVRMKGTTLTSGSFTIDPFGAGTSTSCVADSSTATVEQFGMRISTAGSGVTAAANPTEAASYNCASANHNFYTNATTGTGSTYGGVIASTSGATAESQSTMEFAAKAATTTEAGIYTTTLTFIATGTY